MGLTETELTSMRTEVEKYFDSTCDVYRSSTPVDDAYGGHEGGTPTLVYKSVSCEVQPGVAHIVDRPDAGQLVFIEEYTVTVAYGTDIQKGDILEIGSMRLRVNVVLDPQSQGLQLQVLTDREVLNA